MRTLNVQLAAILLAITAVFGIGVYFLHGYQVHRNAYVFKREADRAQEQADEAAKKKDQKAELEARKLVAKNLGWYVRLVPDDIDALERLGLLLADLADSPRTFSQAFNTMERVIRVDPERQTVRRRLVDMAMMIRRHQDAKDHLEGFLLKQSPDDPSLWELLGRCNAERGDYELAVDNFKKAIEYSPAQLESYALLASVLRQHLSRAKEADQWMEKLVKVNAKSARAHFLRSNYLRSINADEDALKEAQKCLELAPEDREGLWLIAQCYLGVQDYDNARKYAETGIKLHPSNIALYTTLADIELRSGQREKAVAALQEGLKATERNPQLLWSMANLLIDVDDLEQARHVLDELQAAEYPKQLVDYLRARIDFVQGRWLEARQGFEKVRGLLTLWPNLLKQVDVWIGQCYGQLGNRDRQLESYRRALNVDPFYAPARAGVTEVLLATGNVDDALREYRQLARLGKVGAGGLIPLARMLILQNLRQAPSDRNWEPALQVLDEAEKANPNAVQVPILRAEICVARNEIEEAERLLKEAREKTPDSPELWAVLASLAQRQQEWDKAEAILENYFKATGDTVEYRLLKAQHLVRRDGQKAADELHKLAEDVGRFNDAQRLQLWGGLLNSAMQIDDVKEAKKLCQLIAEKEPQNVQVRYLAFEQALREEDIAGMEAALNEIERVAGRGAYWSYGQAVRLSLQARDNPNAPAMLKEAMKLLEQAREQRPSWSRVPLLMAGINDQEGKSDAALKNYLEAIEMGERNPGAIRRAVQLLFQKQRYAEADRLLRQLEKQQVPFSPEMTRASAEVALRQGEFERALEMARKSASEDSKNFQEHLWLGQVLGIIGRRAKAQRQFKEAEQLLAEAEKSLRQAVELNPEMPATWVALIQFLSANEAEEQAEKAIEEAGKRIPVKDAPLALAQCYEAMKRPEQAEVKYEEALAAAPQDPFIVRSVADFYCRCGKPVPAEALLRRILDGKVSAQESDIAWSRRQLALIFAARGGYQNLQKARELIEENLAAAENSVWDRRLKASLDASDPQRLQREEAIKTLETMLRDQSATPEDLFQLAKMYQSAGNWRKASDQLRKLVATYGNEPRYLATYISALLEHGESSNAEAYLSQLERTHPNHIITIGLRAELLVARKDPAKALELLEGFVDRENAQPPERNLRIRLVAEKIEQLGQRLTKPADKPMVERFARKAETLYRAYVEQNPGQDWVVVAFLGRQGRIDEALDLLTQTWETGNPQVLSQICSVLLRDSKIGAEQLNRLGKLLRTALNRFDRPVPLLMVAADLYTKQARYQEAEAAYREVLKKNSGNAYAMNNLAVLLALQGIKTEEALELINKAIEIAGPVAAMLDSRATVYMALNDPQRALEDMNDALIDAETPVRLFHQAQAYELAGQNNAAASAFEKALDKGLTKEMLQPLEYPIFEKLQQLPR